MKSVAGCVLLGIGFLALPQSPEPAQDKADPLLAARKTYRAQVIKAFEPIRERYQARLKSLQEEFTRKGDLEQALKAKTMLAASKFDPWQPAERRMEGTWVVNYTNGASRTYHVDADGTVHFHGFKRSAKLLRRGGDLLWEFKDGTIERVEIQDALVIDHFTPGSNYSKGEPIACGVGTRAATK